MKYEYIAVYGNSEEDEVRVRVILNGKDVIARAYPTFAEYEEHYDDLMLVLERLQRIEDDRVEIERRAERGLASGYYTQPYSTREHI
jgi:hypothetical protein